MRGKNLSVKSLVKVPPGSRDGQRGEVAPAGIGCAHHIRRQAEQLARVRARLPLGERFLDRGEHGHDRPVSRTQVKWMATLSLR